MKTEPGPFQWCPVTGSEAIGTNRRFCLNISKCFFTVQVTVHWHMLPTERLRSLCLLGELWKPPGDCPE